MNSRPDTVQGVFVVDVPNTSIGQAEPGREKGHWKTVLVHIVYVIKY